MNGVIIVEIDGSHTFRWPKGGRLSNVHKPEDCQSRHCVIHNPSDHHMKDWPLILRGNLIWERQCKHGVGHPDPDSLYYLEKVLGKGGAGVHGCDGCCIDPIPYECHDCKVKFGGDIHYLCPDCRIKNAT